MLKYNNIGAFERGVRTTDPDPGCRGTRLGAERGVAEMATALQGEKDTRLQRREQMAVRYGMSRTRVAVAPDLAIERFKTSENNSIHVLKHFLISKSLPYVRGMANGGVCKVEVIDGECVGNANTDKYALGRVCAHIFEGGVTILAFRVLIFDWGYRRNRSLPSAYARLGRAALAEMGDFSPFAFGERALLLVALKHGIETV